MTASLLSTVWRLGFRVEIKIGLCFFSGNSSQHRVFAKYQIEVFLIIFLLYRNIPAFFSNMPNGISFNPTWFATELYNVDKFLKRHRVHLRNAYSPLWQERRTIYFGTIVCALWNQCITMRFK
jgi:hypothetical protein